MIVAAGLTFLRCGSTEASSAIADSLQDYSLLSCLTSASS